jgi:hypothetical protein
MNNRAQAALEYLLTYGWALVVIAIVLGSILLLTSSASSPHYCQMNPSSGALTYFDHFISSSGEVQIMLRNDSGKTINNVDLSFSGDFASAAASSNNGPYVSAQEFSITTAGLTLGNGVSYNNGVIAITYVRNNVTHISTAVCSGVT